MCMCVGMCMCVYVDLFIHLVVRVRVYQGFATTPIPSSLGRYSSLDYTAVYVCVYTCTHLYI